MGINLSHSALEKYRTCPAMYKNHYILKIRSASLSSALLFGNAIDETLNVLLETKLDNPPETATDDLERLKRGFEHHLTFVQVGKEVEDIRTTHFVDYYKSDFDPDVLTEVELKSLSTFIQNAGYEEEDPIALFNLIRSAVDRKEDIAATDQSYINYASWLSLKRKGHLMIEHYINEIMPKIKRVTSIQGEVELPNEDGDLIRGKIDFEGEFVDHEGIFTIDNKTSGSLYKKVDVNDKGQLLIYDEFTQHGQAAYIVLIKKISYIKKLTCRTCGGVTNRAVKSCAEKNEDGKRCGGELDLEKIPYVRSQIITDSINNEKKDLLFEEINDILSSIENEEFPQNRDKNCFHYGRPCIYYNYCRSNPADPDITGLVKSEI